jgi:hypothetical protein
MFPSMWSHPVVPTWDYHQAFPAWNPLFVSPPWGPLQGVPYSGSAPWGPPRVSAPCSLILGFPTVDLSSVPTTMSHPTIPIMRYSPGVPSKYSRQGVPFSRVLPVGAYIYLLHRVLLMESILSTPSS